MTKFHLKKKKKKRDSVNSVEKIKRKALTPVLYFTMLENLFSIFFWCQESFILIEKDFLFFYRDGGKMFIIPEY